ncbi:MAG: hypothetical protein QXJ50_03770 [Candidatus Woesearchaeota archaeon]
MKRQILLIFLFIMLVYVTNAASLGVSPDRLDFRASQQNLQLTIFNTGNEKINVSITENSGMFIASLQNVVVEAGSSQTINVTALKKCSFSYLELKTSENSIMSFRIDIPLSSECPPKTPNPLIGFLVCAGIASFGLIPLVARRFVN